jgi:hypothetical protein
LFDLTFVQPETPQAGDSKLRVSFLKLENDQFKGERERKKLKNTVLVQKSIFDN